MEPLQNAEFENAIKFWFLTPRSIMHQLGWNMAQKTGPSAVQCKANLPMICTGCGYRTPVNCGSGSFWK